MSLQPISPAGPAVALKLLRRDLVLRSTFLREFCVGRCVSAHPGLLQTLAGPLQTPRYFAFAQEYAPCGDLSGMLQERVRPRGTKVGSAYPRSNSVPSPVSISNSDPQIRARPTHLHPEPPHDLPLSNSQRGSMPDLNPNPSNHPNTIVERQGAGGGIEDGLESMKGVGRETGLGF